MFLMLRWGLRRPSWWLPCDVYRGTTRQLSYYRCKFVVARFGGSGISVVVRNVFSVVVRDDVHFGTG